MKTKPICLNNKKKKEEELHLKKTQVNSNKQKKYNLFRSVN